MVIDYPSREMSTAARAETTSVKMEDGDANSNGDLPTKTEPFNVDASPNEDLDDDIYEDAGDVDFADYSTGVFLTRIPKYLWRTWSDSNEEQDIQIGTIRVEGGMDSPQAVSSSPYSYLKK